MRKAIILLLLIFLFSAQTLYAEGDFDFNSEEFLEIISFFSMQGHSDHEYSTCTTKQAYYEEVSEMIIEGRSNDEIVDYYVNQFGESALKVPNKKGFSLIAWVMPFFALGVAGTGLFLGLRKWVGSKNKTDDDEISNSKKPEGALEKTEVEILQSVIDEERKKYL